MNKAWCIRDNLSRFVCACVTWDCGPHSILEAEALALKEIIHGAITMHLENVIFKSDSQRVI